MGGYPQQVLISEAGSKLMYVPMSLQPLHHVRPTVPREPVTPHFNLNSKIPSFGFVSFYGQIVDIFFSCLY